MISKKYFQISYEQCVLANLQNLTHHSAWLMKTGHDIRVGSQIAN